MLQILKPSTAPDHVAPAPEYISPAELFKMVVGFLHRQYPTIVLTFALMMALGAVYLYATPDKFTAQAKLMIDTRKVQLLQQQSILGDAPPNSAAIDSQVEILQSENIALAVIKDLRLTEDPEFTGPNDSVVAVVLGFFSGLFASPGGPPSDFGLTRAAIWRLQSHLNVKRAGLTYIINIEFRSRNAERAAQVTNAVADAYIVDQLEAKYEATRRAGKWLQDRIRELREQATIAERAVLDYKEKNNIVDSGGRLLNEQQLGELNSALLQSRAQTAEAKAQLERIDQIIRMEVPDATVTDTLRNEVITKLRSTYLDYARKEADLSARYGRNHLAAVNLRNQMTELRRSIIDELNRIAQTYRSDYEIAKAREESVTKGLADIVSVSQTTNQAQVVLRELESSAQTYRALHDSFLQRHMESVQQQSFPISEARLITQAVRPGRASHPRSLLILFVSAAGGVMLGFGLAVLRDISDRSFRTSDQVGSILHTDCIAVLPKMKDAVRGQSSAPRADYGELDPRIIARDRSVLWAVIDSPFSRFAESMRAIKVATDLNKSAKPNKVVGITSSLPNEGKSTISVSLAQSIASNGGRVLLLDCDLRNPGLSRRLTPRAEFALLDVLAGRVSFDDAVCFDPSTYLSFLPAATEGRIARSSEVLASNATKMLFESLRQKYDYIIVDLSPLAPVVDVRAMTHLVDSFVFVIEWGRTKIDVVEHVLGESREVYENLLGVVLNKADLKTLSRYDSQRGSYYHNRYYARYGYTD